MTDERMTWAKNLETGRYWNGPRSQVPDGYAEIPLAVRIGQAIDRVKDGLGNMRIPADPSDPDLVLADCVDRIIDLGEVVQEDRRILLATIASIGSVEFHDSMLEAGSEYDLEIWKSGGTTTLTAIRKGVAK